MIISVFLSCLLIVVSENASSSDQSEDLHLKEIFKQKNVVVQVILDGVGIGHDDPLVNPIIAANSITYDRIRNVALTEGLYMTLRASGEAVGLSRYDNGNSEAGHMHMSSLRIHRQGTVLVDQALESGDIMGTTAWEQIIKKTARRKGATLHFMGLLSDGNCFGHIKHLFGLMDAAVESGIKSIRVHVTLDGVDVRTDGLVYVRKVEEKFDKLKKFGVDGQIASGGGRGYTSIVKNSPAIVERGWKAMHGLINEADITSDYKGYYTSAEEAILACRKLFPERGDALNLPFVIVDKEQHYPVGVVKSGDTVVNFNFRGDYQIGISQAFTEEDDTLVPFVRTSWQKGGGHGPRPSNVTYATLMPYKVNYPRFSFVNSPVVTNTLPDYLAANNKTSWLCTETYKYTHLTQFYNGGHITSKYPSLEKWVKIDSLPDNLTESHPEMRAREITDALLAALRDEKRDFYYINLANSDMVGHTGNFTQCVAAWNTVMECVERIEKAVEEMNGTLLIHADHGNIEEKMRNGSHRSHTVNTVPFLIRDFTHPPEQKGTYKLVDPITKPRGRLGEDPDNVEGWGLSNIGATVLNLLGLEAPAGADNRDSLIAFVGGNGNEDVKKESKQVCDAEGILCDGVLLPWARRVNA